MASTSSSQSQNVEKDCPLHTYLIVRGDKHVLEMLPTQFILHAMQYLSLIEFASHNFMAKGLMSCVQPLHPFSSVMPCSVWPASVTLQSSRGNGQQNLTTGPSPGKTCTKPCVGSNTIFRDP